MSVAVLLPPPTPEVLAKNVLKARPELRHSTKVNRSLLCLRRGCSVSLVCGVGEPWMKYSRIVDGRETSRWDRIGVIAGAWITQKEVQRM
jgi:hypothetical protein